MDRDITTAWRLYEAGRDFNSTLSPNRYDMVDTNAEFFAGRQWPNVRETAASKKIYKPVFNVIARVAKLFIASITSTGLSVHIDPLSYYDGSGTADPDHDIASFAEAEVTNLLEKNKFEYRVRDALFDGARSGDYCMHIFFDPDAMPYGAACSSTVRGEIRMELVDGINVIFGNPNNTDVESQPYILIVGRDTVENLRTEARNFRRNRKIYSSAGSSPDDPDSIQPDSENLFFTGTGGKTEISAPESEKALYVLMYSKVTEYEDSTDRDGNPLFEDVMNSDGNPVYEQSGGKNLVDSDGQPVPKRKPVKKLKTSVHVTKATRTATIYEDVDTGLSVYPIAWGNWEREKNCYHGNALVTELIPNQIFLNQMFALTMTHMQRAAIPQVVYNADLIPYWSNEVGRAIGVHAGPDTPLPQVAYPVPVAEMSSQIFTVIDKVVAYTKECIGATDAQMGNVKPDNTSALMVLQTNAEVPLENVRAGVNEWTEDIVRILLDMMGTYYGERPVRIRQDFPEIVTDAAGMPQIDPNTGMLVTKNAKHDVMSPFDFSVFKRVFLNVGVDVGAAPYYSKIAMLQTLDGLLRNGVINALQYLERMPDDMIPKRQDLLDELQSQPQEQQTGGVAAGADTSPIMGADLSTEKIDWALPQSVQSMINRPGYPANAQRTARRIGNLRATR